VLLFHPVETDKCSHILVTCLCRPPVRDSAVGCFFRSVVEVILEQKRPNSFKTYIERMKKSALVGLLLVLFGGEMPPK